MPTVTRDDSLPQAEHVDAALSEALRVAALDELSQLDQENDVLRPSREATGAHLMLYESVESLQTTKRAAKRTFMPLAQLQAMLRQISGGRPLIPSFTYRKDVHAVICAVVCGVGAAGDECYYDFFVFDTTQ